MRRLNDLENLNETLMQVAEGDICENPKLLAVANGVLISAMV